MRYIKILFTKGLQCEAFQEVNDYGFVVRYLDVNGEEIELPDVTESRVLSDNITPPFDMKTEEKAAVIEEVVTVDDKETEEQMPTTVSELEDKIRAIIAELT